MTLLVVGIIVLFVKPWATPVDYGLVATGFWSAFSGAVAGLLIGLGVYYIVKENKNKLIAARKEREAANPKKST